MVSSLKIAELFERPHNAVLKAIRNELTDEISLGEIDQSDYLDSRGKRQPTYWLDERQALVVMPFLGGVNARIGQRKLVDAYLYFRDHFCDPRKDLLALKRSAHLPLMDAIQEFRELQGKLTDERHYQCENKLCNWVVTGKFAAIDEKRCRTKTWRCWPRSGSATPPLSSPASITTSVSLSWRRSGSGCAPRCWRWRHD